MKNKDKNEIKVVIMNPECIPAVRQKLFDFFYDKFVKTSNDKNI